LCCDNNLSLAKLQIDEPEIECVCEKKWGSYEPSYSCGGLQRGSYDAGCFCNRGKEYKGWDGRAVYGASDRYSTDRSNRGSYGVGRVWRGQDRCLNFQNTCPQKCIESEDLCSICQKPVWECKCARKPLKICREEPECYQPKYESCYEQKWECSEEPECLEPKYRCYKDEWECDEEPKWGLDFAESLDFGCEKKLDLCNLCQKPAIQCQCQKKCLKCY
jgi:hypothetical protein